MPRNYPVPQSGPVDSTSATQKDGIIFPSAARNTGAYNSQEYVNPGAKGLRVYISTTVVGGAGTLDVKIQNYDPASAQWMDVPEAAATQVATNTTAMFTMYPGQEEDAGSAVTEPLGVRWRLVATVGGNAVTFSIGADYLDR